MDLLMIWSLTTLGLMAVGADFGPALGVGFLATLTYLYFVFFG